MASELARKKPDLTIMVGAGRHELPEGDRKEQPEQEGGGEYEAMASELLDAIEAKDTKALAEVFKSFCEACSMAEPDGDD